MNNLLFILGTRPEAIKLSPLILKAQKNSDTKVEIILTSQHPQLCRETLANFGIIPTRELEAFESEQGLTMLSARILTELANLKIDWKNSLVCVQGDTTSAIMGAYAAYLQGSKVAHIEAGLRSHDYFPFPEEMNRKLISSLAEFNFCATKSNAQNLIAEGIDKEKIYVVGNTVIDAMLHFNVTKRQPVIEKSILITLHRRENHGEVIHTVTKIINQLVQRFNNGFRWIFITHPNPNVQSSYHSEFKSNPNIEFRSPMPYPEILQELRDATLLITDSGGFQEEATFLGLPTIILRRTTERNEAISAGCCMLVPNPEENLEDLVINFLQESEGNYLRTSKPSLVFGAGNSASKIMEILQTDFNVNFK